MILASPLYHSFESYPFQFDHFSVFYSNCSRTTSSKIHFNHAIAGLPEFGARFHRSRCLCDGNFRQHKFKFKTHRIVSHHHITADCGQFNFLQNNRSGRTSYSLCVLLVSYIAGVRPLRSSSVFRCAYCGI